MVAVPVSALAWPVRDGSPGDDRTALVVTGAGDKAFCAGADLDPRSAPFQMDASAARLAYADALRAMIHCEKLLVARINGACMAGGMGLLGASDIVIASDSAKFGLPEVGIGVFPMMVAAILQNRLAIPARDLAALCYTGDPIDARRAREIGLVTSVVPAAELDAAVEALVEKLASRSPTAIRHGKRTLTAMRGMGWDEALAYAEAQIRLVALTEDAKEGVRAFGEKRAPSWTGK